MLRGYAQTIEYRKKGQPSASMLETLNADLYTLWELSPKLTWNHRKGRIKTTFLSEGCYMSYSLNS